MLLFACSGLDATVKQLVRDGLEAVLAYDEGAQSQFAIYVERRLKKGVAESQERNSNTGLLLDFALLSKTLASLDPRHVLINMLRDSLTADSLQSRDQLLRVAAQFAIESRIILESPKVTGEAFRARNQVAHEMDIEFRDEEAGRRTRQYRDMVRWSENILNVAGKFILAVSAKIPDRPLPTLDQIPSEQYVPEDPP
jgi:hypothetical protein